MSNVIRLLRLIMGLHQSSWVTLLCYEYHLNNNTIQKHFCSTQNPSFDWVPLLENPGWNNVASLACNAPYNTRNPQEYRVSTKKTTIYFKMWFHSGNLYKKKHTFLVTAIKLTVFQCIFFMHNLVTMKFENS